MFSLQAPSPSSLYPSLLTLHSFSEVIFYLQVTHKFIFLTHNSPDLSTQIPQCLSSTLNQLKCKLPYPQSLNPKNKSRGPFLVSPLLVNSVMIHLVMHSRTLGIMNDILYRSLPHSINHHLFPHVIHDAHETCQQFGFLSSSKFLLGLLLAALLYPRGCHPPSVSAAHARDLPGRARGCTFQARCGLCSPKHRGWESGWLYHSACGSAGTPQTLQ